MAATTSKLLWCTIRLSKDKGTWWVKENSDPKHYEPDGLGILDPFQLPWVLDMMDPLREYGLSNEILEAAFITFQVHSVEKDEISRPVDADCTNCNEDILTSLNPARFQSTPKADKEKSLPETTKNKEGEDDDEYEVTVQFINDGIVMAKLQGYID